MARKLVAALVAVAALAGCGSEDPAPRAETARVPEADLGTIKDYLLAHTATLREQTAALAADAEAYYAAAEAAGFDYPRLVEQRQTAELIERMQAT